MLADSSLQCNDTPAFQRRETVPHVQGTTCNRKIIAKEGAGDCKKTWYDARKETKIDALPNKYQGLIANEVTAQTKNPLFHATTFGKRTALQAKVAKLAAPNIKESQHEPCIVDKGQVRQRYQQSNQA